MSSDPSGPAGADALEVGRSLLAQGRYEAAVGAVQALATAGDPEALVLQSTAMRRAGRPRPALAAARQAAHALPSWGPALAAVAAAAAELRRPGEAATAAQQAIALAPGDPDVWNAAGLAALAELEPAEAERCFRHGLGLDPHHPEIAAHLARLEHGRPPGAPMGDDEGPGASVPAGPPRRGGFERFLRRSRYVSVLPEEPDHEAPPVLLMAWAGVVVVAIGAFLFLLAAR